MRNKIMELIYCITALLAPTAILAVGVLWKLSPPKYRGNGLAYRTALSSSSSEAWAFAHRHCSRLWIRIGTILLVLSAAILIIFPDNKSVYFLWLIGGQMALFCCSAFLVDILLKNTFDENGHPL